MSFINPYIFREYDVRGKVLEDFPEHVVIKLGKAFGTYVKRFGGKVIALSVDHRIRKESASEIEQVGKWLARYRIEHHVLNWVREKRSFDGE